MKGNLKEHLIALKQGDEIVLHKLKTQFGDKVPNISIFFQNGRWMHRTINCFSSLELGLGACGCYSHPPYKEERISRKEMLSYLRQHLREEKEEDQARQAEIAWLDEQINSLPD